MPPSKFSKFQNVWAKDGQGREWMGQIRARWHRTGGQVIYRVYIFSLNKSFEVQESDLRECDEEF